MNIDVEQSFGEFIAKKREEKKITLREMARLLKITPPYLSDIEKDRRNPPEKEKMDKIAEILLLSTDERRVMYDLAGKKRNTVSSDLPDYIMEKDYVRLALRTAMDLDAGEDEWLKFVEDLNNRKG
ncbi:helix-turn-helix domain-containing protein [Clostridium butyricum]|uniref:helix-turn-helix domain-containing protein n=1 Tax=Clostridium butyricum TaxID=1492 RepID=UPI00374F2CE6